MSLGTGDLMRIDMWRRTARGVGAIAIIFSLVVGVLLTTDWLRAGQARTVRSDRLSQVLAAARQTSDGGMKTLALDMDLMARHAYFSSVEFRNSGIWLLVAGLLVAVASLHLAAQLGHRIEDPRLFPAVDQLRADRHARLAMLLAGVGCLLLLTVWGLEGASPTRVPLSTNTVAVADHANTVAAPPAAKAAAAAPVAATARSENSAFQWNCFRGPRCGAAPWTNGPTSWNGRTGAGIVWKTALEKSGGLSSPVVNNGRIYLTVGDEQTPEVRQVVAFDAANGRELWRKAVKFMGEGDLPATSSGTGLGAPTPVCDDAGVYALFGTGDLAAYSPAGDLLWQVYIGRPDIGYGYGASPIIHAGRIFIQYDHNGDDARVLAVDARTGKTLWQKKRTAGSSWCTPLLATGADGGQMLVLEGRSALSAYDPSTGRELWNIDDDVTGEVSPSPACWNGRVILGLASARAVCYELGAQPVQKWEDKESDLPDIASPVAAEGLVVMPGKGALTCLDALTGAKHWAHDFNGAYPSPLIDGRTIYALDGDGVTHVIALERQFHEIAACPLGEGESSEATPALADGRIYIRTQKTLWCIGAK